MATSERTAGWLTNPIIHPDGTSRGRAGFISDVPPEWPSDSDPQSSAASAPRRLALNWVGKGHRLLATADGGYEWVDRHHPHVTEVRLLRGEERVGDASPGDAFPGNLLVVGDSQHALRSLIRIPEYAAQYHGKVRLVYIDPPFNTGQLFRHYDDALEHSVWLTMMRDRLLLIRELLAPEGSVWVHVDDTEMAYCRVLMDEVFGRNNFVASIIWQKIRSEQFRAAHLVRSRLHTRVR